MVLIVDIPEAVAAALNNPPGTLAQNAKEAVVLEAYRQGRISRGAIGEALGLDYWGTEDFFRQRQVPLNYRLEDLEADRRTLALLFPVP